MKKTWMGTALGAAMTGALLAGDVVTTPAGSATLRDLEADRPDSTESPRTVDKGHFQIEITVVGYGRDRSGGVLSESWTWGETNFKYGLTDSIDLQLVFAPYVREVTTVGGAKTVVEGASDVTLRMKCNLWGNDEGDTAMAIFPYVKIPTNTAVSNGEWEGGVILPWATQLSERVGFGMQVEIARVWDDESGEYGTDILHTAVLGFDVTEKLGLYIEYVGISGDNPYQAYASGGATWAISDQFQWDVGSVVGLNDEAEDLNVFTGFTVKF